MSAQEDYIFDQPTGERPAVGVERGRLASAAVALGAAATLFLGHTVEWVTHPIKDTGNAVKEAGKNFVVHDILQIPSNKE